MEKNTQQSQLDVKFSEVTREIEDQDLEKCFTFKKILGWPSLGCNYGGGSSSCNSCQSPRCDKLTP